MSDMNIDYCLECTKNDKTICPFCWLGLILSLEAWKTDDELSDLDLWSEVE